MKKTYGNWLDMWLESKHELRHGTRQLYATIIRDYLKPGLGERYLSELNFIDLQLFCNNTVDQLESSRMHHLRAVLSGSIKAAWRAGIIPADVAAGLSVPPVRSAPVVPLNLFEVQHLREHLRGAKYEVLINLAMITGLRRGEVLGLRWCDLDLDKRTLTVVQNLQERYPRGMYIEAPKNGRIRKLTLARQLLPLLHDHRVRWCMNKLAQGPSWRGRGEFADLVFVNGFGGPLSPRFTTLAVERDIRCAGLGQRRFHDLRHTAASLALKSGANFKEVQMMLGHSSIKITLDIYGHLEEDALTNLADRMDDLLEVN